MPTRRGSRRLASASVSAEAPGDTTCIDISPPLLLPSAHVSSDSSVSSPFDVASDAGSTATAATESTASCNHAALLQQKQQQQQPQQQQDRPKILCLGASYASMEKQLQRYNIDPIEWMEGRSLSELTAADVVTAVQQGLLTEMDGRDLARVVATKRAVHVDIYTVSQEKAALYETTRHLEADFNHHRFINNLLAEFGEDANGNRKADATANTNNINKYQDRKFDDSVYRIRFRQAILDYYWIPPGWTSGHWFPCFFSDIIPQFVTKRMLDMEDNESNAHIPCAIYLPFCFFCLRQVVNALPKLSQYFAISFLRRNELEEHTFWKGTQMVDPDDMQHYLGKKIDQEENYCTIDARTVKEAGIGPLDEPKKYLLDILKRLEDFDEIRFIKLRPLAQFHPTKTIPKELHEKGGLKGLVDPRKVKRGFKEEAAKDETNDGTSADSNNQKSTLKSPAKASSKRKRSPDTTPEKKRQQSSRKRNCRPNAQRALFDDRNSNDVSQPELQELVGFDSPTAAAAAAAATAAATTTNEASASRSLHTRSSRRNVEFVSLPLNSNKRKKATRTDRLNTQETPSSQAQQGKIVTPDSGSSSTCAQAPTKTRPLVCSTSRRALTLKEPTVKIVNNHTEVASPAPDSDRNHGSILPAAAATDDAQVASEETKPSAAMDVSPRSSVAEPDVMHTTPQLESVGAEQRARGVAKSKTPAVGLANVHYFVAKEQDQPSDPDAVMFCPDSQKVPIKKSPVHPSKSPQPAKRGGSILSTRHLNTEPAPSCLFDLLPPAPAVSQNPKPKSSKIAMCYASNSEDSDVDSWESAEHAEPAGIDSDALSVEELDKQLAVLLDNCKSGKSKLPPENCENSQWVEVKNSRLILGKPSTRKSTIARSFSVTKANDSHNSMSSLEIGYDLEQSSRHMAQSRPMMNIVQH